MSNVQQTVQSLVNARSEIVRQHSAMADLAFESEPSPSLASFLRSAGTLAWYFERCRQKAAADGLEFPEVEKLRPAGADDTIQFPKSDAEFRSTGLRINDLARSLAMDLVAANEMIIAANVLEEAEAVVRFFESFASAPSGADSASPAAAASPKSIAVKTVTTFTYTPHGEIQVRDNGAKCDYLIEGSAPLDAFRVHEALSAELKAKPPHPSFALDTLTVHSRAASIATGLEGDADLQATALFVRRRQQSSDQPVAPAA